ncbi:MAG: hypothetical protein ACI4JD_00445 [Ruminococcus sp.]
MSVIKKLLPFFMIAAMAAPLFGCSSNKDESSEKTSSDSSTSESAETENTEQEETEAETEPATVQESIPLEYDDSDVENDCADVINKYFTAVINQDYESYKSTLDPYYFDVYNTWLDGSYGYGMETSFETLHQNLMDAAVTANGGNDVTDVVITNLKLSGMVSEGEEGAELVTEYLGRYDSIIGEGFTDELKKQCDDIVDVKFTMTADCDGTELEILTEMELLMTVTGGEYRILG